MADNGSRHGSTLSRTSSSSSSHQFSNGFASLRTSPSNLSFPSFPDVLEQNDEDEDSFGENSLTDLNSGPVSFFGGADMTEFAAAEPNPDDIKPEIAERRQNMLREMSLDMGKRRDKERMVLEREIIFGEPVIGLEDVAECSPTLRHYAQRRRRNRSFSSWRVGGRSHSPMGDEGPSALPRKQVKMKRGQIIKAVGSLSPTPESAPVMFWPSGGVQDPGATLSSGHWVPPSCKPLASTAPAADGPSRIQQSDPSPLQDDSYLDGLPAADINKHKATTRSGFGHSSGETQVNLSPRAVGRGKRRVAEWRQNRRASR